MPFLSLSPYNFRNLCNENIDLSSKEIYFVGKNGQGKSNLLESLYYSAYGSSFRTHVDSEVIKKNESEMSLRCLFREENGTSHTTSIILKEKLKKIEKDGKILHDRKELINTMPCVLYSHEDLDFAVGSPERRRFFIDQSLSMYDVLYIDIMRKYKRILKNRNLSLKEKHYDLLETYDFQLAQNGLEIQKKRKDAVFSFNQIFGKLYEQVTGISGVSIKYIPSWKNKSDNLNSPFFDRNIPSVDYVVDYLSKIREQEKIIGSSISGPHRDKIVFEKEYLIKEPDFSSEPYTVEKSEEEEGVYIVEGPRIERMLGYTNLDSEKGFEFFQKFLKTNGILEQLEELGIEEGDTVKMYGWQFDYYK